MLKLIVVFSSILFIHGLNAQAPCKCCAAEYRQFDFWLGHWEVYNPSGQLVGFNTVELEQDGCALKETWTGLTGIKGTSLNYYDQRAKKWNQLWIDNSGGNLSMSGSYTNSQMIFYTEVLFDEQKKENYKVRITFTNHGDGTIRQLWERTIDEGENWSTVFDGVYKKMVMR